MDSVRESIAVLGAGSWGTALAVVACRGGRHTVLWGHDRARIDEIARSRRNDRYLPGVELPAGLAVTSDLAAVAACSRLLVAVPSRAFRATLRAVAGQRRRLGIDVPLTMAWGTKGFEPGTGALLDRVAREELGEGARLAVISGPSFAAEVARRQPTALTSAAADLATAGEAAGWLRDDRMRIYTSTDLTGVQLGGAIKNVMAIATGIGDGLGLGSNSRAALVTRGLAEMTRLGRALGGQPATFMGLAGIGDLILTCTDDQSRNRRVGIGLGRGQPLAQVLAAIGQEAEGVHATREVMRLGRRHGVEMPISEQVHRVLFEGQPPLAAVEELLAREPRDEGR